MPIQFLTSPEISQWLKNVGQVEDPHTGETQPPFVAMFYSPVGHIPNECFARVFLAEIIREGEILIHITDFGHSNDASDFVFQSIWLADGESRSFYDVPACKIPQSDWEKAIAIFSLTASFGWKAYLYGARDQTTLYNWEGEIFDVWTSNSKHLESLARILHGFDLKLLEDSD